MSTNSMRTGRSERLAQAWLVPRWTTASPTPTRVSEPSSSSSQVSPSSTMPTSTDSVRCMGEAAPGAISVKRTRTPFGAGGGRSGRGGGPGSGAAIRAGVTVVAHSSWKTALPMSSVLGVGPSDRTTDLPDASWPVTMRRGTSDMRRLLSAGHPGDVVLGAVVAGDELGQQLVEAARALEHRQVPGVLEHDRVGVRADQALVLVGVAYRDEDVVAA